MERPPNTLERAHQLVDRVRLADRYDRTEYPKGRLQAAGVKLPFSAPTFNEFVAAFPPGFAQTHRRLLEKKIVAGLALEPYYPELRDHYLFCATETMRREELDALVREVQS